MKIIYTSIEDFINQEISEHGFDYVDAMFAAGYEPMLVNGQFYAWVNVLQPNTSNHVSSNTISCTLSNSGANQPSSVNDLVA